MRMEEGWFIVSPNYGVLCGRILYSPNAKRGQVILAGPRRFSSCTDQSQCFFFFLGEESMSKRSRDCKQFRPPNIAISMLTDHHPPHAIEFINIQDESESLSNLLPIELLTMRFGLICDVLVQA